MTSSISIVSPSSPLTEEQIAPTKSAILYLAGLGLEVKHDRALFSLDIKSPEYRAKQFMDEYLSQESDILLASRGGSSAIEILELLDYEKLFQAKPKPILGYSDLTTLALALNNYAQKHSYKAIPFYHAPMLFECASWANATKDSFELGIEKIRNKIQNQNFEMHFDDLSAGLKAMLQASNSCILQEFNTPILGGNLSIIISLIGTGYLPSFKDSILFIEECNEPLYKVERMLWQMHYAKLFHGVKELWIGISEEAEIPMDLLMNFADIYGFRILRDLPIGHGKLNFVTKLF